MAFPAARSLFQFLISKFPLKILSSFNNHPSIFPYYHIVADKLPWYFDNAYPVKSIHQFEKDIDFFLRFWNPITLEELINFVSSTGQLPKKCFHLTFDDGFKEIYQNIFPILKRKGIPATTFLCSSLIDNHSLHWEHKKEILLKYFLKNTSRLHVLPGTSNNLTPKENENIILKLGYHDQQFMDSLANNLGINYQHILNTEKPYLTISQVAEMVKEGFTFGSHSIDHPHFQELSFENQILQWIESTNVVTKTFNLQYRVFAFPYGEDGLSKELFDFVFDNQSIDLCFGIRGCIPDQFPAIIQRIWMESDFTTSKTIRQELAKKYIRKLVHNDCVTRKREAS